ncbi:MAG: MmgE/PrpD family protein, partial [Gammaproteobacteria bacterium]|nr:MmgE/PrpD family protein [Gammaproteobacteria bacterium]
MTLTQDLIQLIQNKPVRAVDLKSAAIFTLDAVATAYAGKATPVGQILRDWATNTDFDLKRQALLMGALTHITETDDLHRTSVTHPGCVVIPAALSLGEKLNSSPQQILTAILHGFEAMCRIGAAVGPMHYKVWHNTATCGPFGSAMAAATLLGLDDEQTLHALGNAGTQSSGFWQFMETGAMSKHLHAGRACESGLLAAELAASGFTGSPEILEGTKGMFAGMCIDPIPDNILTDADGPWQLPLTSIKPWPSCRHTHPAIDCALELQGQLNYEVIDSIEIDTYQAALDVCDRPQPKSEYQAKFSLYHCISIALLDGKVTLDSFNHGAINRTTQLRQATSINVVNPYASNYPDSWGSAVRITTKNGETLEVSRKDCKGDPELALSDHEMLEKAASLMIYGGLDKSSVADVYETILSLPDSRDSMEI